MVARVQNNGLANITAAWEGYASKPIYAQWGTGSGAAATANVVTTTGTAESRATGTSSRQTTTVTNDTWRVIATITATASRTITEVGLFDAAGTGNPPTGGNMCIYGDFPAVGLQLNDSIQFTVDTKFA
jgi:hypothetical protein